MRKDVTPQQPSKRSRAASTPEEQLASSSSKKRRKLSHTTQTASITKPNGAARSASAANDRPIDAAADAYEVPDSDEDRPRPTSAKIGNGTKRPGQADSHHLRVSDSETADEPPAPQTSRKPGQSPRQDGDDKSPPGHGTGLAVPKTRAPNAAAVKSVEDEDKPPNGTATENNPSVRSSGRRRVPTSKAIEGQDLVKRSRLDTSASRSRSTSAAVGTPQAASRFHDAPVSKAATPLKGILTPSRRDGDRRRKSVAFGGIEGTKTPGKLFADIPKTSEKKRGRKKQEASGAARAETTPRTKTLEQIARDIPKAIPPPTLEGEEESDEQTAEEAVGEPAGGASEKRDVEVEKAGGKNQEEEEEEEEEESVCSICSKPNSRKGNEILFCDGCDMAVHQRCYGVGEIPDGDWYCKKCTSEREARATATAQVPNFERHLRGMQRVLLDRCTGRRRLKLVGQDEARDKARQLVEQTVLAGEGNSMLVIGARGSGKTTLVETIIADLAREHGQIFHTVRLNGFIHTDDKLALKEIWRQLGREMEVDQEVTSKSNYADTMASLLALLSHPSEILGAQEGVTSKAVVFAIDEFDMFAAHPRQTLLYNLFDIAQARKAPIAVVGCTTRMDVVEMLEKRVKSRFSHRYVYLSQARSPPAFWQVCRQGLVVDDEDVAGSGLETGLEGHGEFLANWNAMIEGLHRETAFQNLLRYHYFTSKSVAAFLAACVLPLSRMPAGSLRLELGNGSGNGNGSGGGTGSGGPDAWGAEAAAAATTTGLGLGAPNSKLHLLGSLSELDLGLLIAAARLDIVAHTDTVNFAMAYDEYGTLMGRQRVQSATAGMLALGGGSRTWGRGVAVLAWERLISLGLLLPAGLGGRAAGAGGGHGGLEGRMWKVDVALEDIPAGTRLNQVLARWCKEI